LGFWRRGEKRTFVYVMIILKRGKRSVVDERRREGRRGLYMRSRANEGLG
jgi:hypothetical protein